MKIHIFYKHTERAWGGGNQFLKALKKTLQKRRVYEDSIEASGAILFNSYQEMAALVHSFFFLHRKKRVYRLGPIMSLHRAGIKWKIVDWFVVLAANVFADVVIFQSAWALREARKRGFYRRDHVHVILNAVENTVFYPNTGKKVVSEKVHLVYTSWSKNENKGFSFLQFLDNHLDFNKYTLTFIGNSPLVFKNIVMIPPLSSGALADLLRKSDIFISPTKDDACSNAILEALSCGLPVAALDSGGNEELVQKGGLLFKTEQELLTIIDVIAQDLASYQAKISVQSIESVTDQYIGAIHDSIK